jgi:hypothetical protein
MKPKVSRADAQKRATRGFQVLVLNQCITQLRKVKEYQKDGKFSLDEFLRQEKFLSVWKNKTPKEMGNKAKIYAFYSRTYNYALGIPHELIEKVLGGWNDANGKWHRVKPSEVIDALVKKGWLDDPKKTRHGSKFRKNEDGSYSKKCWWNNKYLMDRKIWFPLIEKNKYMDFNDYPRDPEGYVQRALKIITDHYAKYKGEAKHEEPVKQEVKGWREVVGKFKAHNIEDMIHEVETGRDGGGALQNLMAAYKLDAKICEEIEREASMRTREWKAKRLEMVREQKPEPEFNDKEKGIIQEIGRRLLNDKVNEAQAAYVWKTVGATEELIQKWLVRAREKKVEKEAQRLRELNAIAEAKAEKKPEPPKELNDEQLNELLGEMKKLEERK